MSATPGTKRKGGNAGGGKGRGKGGKGRGGARSGASRGTPRAPRSSGAGAGSGHSDTSEVVIQLDRGHASSLSLGALRRADPAVKQVLATATHVVVYESQPQQPWERKDAEGTLFLVQRSKTPTFAVVVLNRLSPHNFVVPITGAVKSATPEQYLMLRGHAAAGVTTGFWFYKVEERDAVARILKSVAAAFIKLRKVRAAAEAAGKSVTGDTTAHIMTMIAPVLKAVAATQPAASATPSQQAPSAAPAPAPPSATGRGQGNQRGGASNGGSRGGRGGRGRGKAPQGSGSPGTSATPRAEDASGSADGGSVASSANVNSVSEALAMLAMRAGASSGPVATPSDAAGSSGAAVGAAVVPPAVPSPAQRTRHAGSASQPVARAGTAKASPLTRTQLRDTLIELLQEDEAFVGVIHDAYLRAHG